MSEPVQLVRRPVRLEYTVTPGAVQSRFLEALAEGRILGFSCPRCGRVYAPPRGSCSACGVLLQGEVELSGKGTVTTFCIVNVPFSGQAAQIPYACASIVLDGAGLPLFHLIQEVAVEEVRMGMRVEPVWVPPEERRPTLESIRYFRPTGEPDVPYDVYREALA